MSRGLFAVFLIMVAACGGDAFETAPEDKPDASPEAAAVTPPADFSGVYDVAVTARQNGCNFASWEEGKVTPNVGFTMTQVREDVVGTVDGITGTAVEWWLGTKSFAGSVAGTKVTLTAYGTRQTNDKRCAYTVNATVEGTLTGDALQGKIVYTARTNKSPDCGLVADGCITQQDFAGARPPQK